MRCAAQARRYRALSITWDRCHLDSRGKKSPTKSEIAENCCRTPRFSSRTAKQLDPRRKSIGQITPPNKGASRPFSRANHPPKSRDFPSVGVRFVKVPAHPARSRTCEKDEEIEEGNPFERGFSTVRE